MRALCVTFLVCLLVSCAKSSQMDEASARKMLARLDTEPECRAYIRGVMKTIALPSFDETKIAHDTMIVVRFTLHQDGHVSDTAVSGATNSPASPLCIRAITAIRRSQNGQARCAPLLAKIILRFITTLALT